MDTAEKIRVLQAKKGSLATLTRESGDVVSALIQKVHVKGDDATVTFMDVDEGVERVLSASEIVDIS